MKAKYLLFLKAYVLLYKVLQVCFERQSFALALVNWLYLFPHVSYLAFLLLRILVKQLATFYVLYKKSSNMHIHTPFMLIYTLNHSESLYLYLNAPITISCDLSLNS